MAMARVVPKKPIWSQPPMKLPYMADVSGRLRIQFHLGERAIASHGMYESLFELLYMPLPLMPPPPCIMYVKFKLLHKLPLLRLFPCFSSLFVRECVKISLIFTSASSGHAIMIPYNFISSNHTRCKMEIPMVYQSSDFQNNTFAILHKFQSLTDLDISWINLQYQHVWSTHKVDWLCDCRGTVWTFLMDVML